MTACARQARVAADFEARVVDVVVQGVEPSSSASWTDLPCSRRPLAGIWADPSKAAASCGGGAADLDLLENLTRNDGACGRRSRSDARRPRRRGRVGEAMGRPRRLEVARGG